MSVTKEQSMAYTEVIEVLKYIPKKDVEKIPKEILEYYQTNMDNYYDFKIDVNKTFEQQKLLEKTKIVLAILFRDYWATQYQKEKIRQKENYDIQKLEEKKKEIYSYDNLFYREKEQETENLALIEYKKERWYNKFFNWIKSIFK